MSVFDKFKEGLSAEEFAELETAVTSLIEEKATEKAKLIAEVLVEEEKDRLEALAEEFTETELATRLEEAKAKLELEYQEMTETFKEVTVEKLQEHANAYVEFVLKEKITEKETELEEEFEVRLAQLEETVNENLDKFLDAEITSKISDELLEGIAINEAFKPIISGIQNLFETHYVNVESDGVKKTEELQAKVAELETKLDESYESKIALNEKVDSLKAGLLIAAKSEGLTLTQKNRLVTMFEGKSYDEVKSKIDTFVQVLEEKETFERTELENINEDIFANIDEEVETLTENKEETVEVTALEAKLNLAEKFLA